MYLNLLGLLPKMSDIAKTMLGGTMRKSLFNPEAIMNKSQYEETDLTLKNASLEKLLQQQCSSL